MLKKKNESDGPDARGETKSESDDKNGDAEDEPNVQTYRENNDSEHHYRAVPHHLEALDAMALLVMQHMYYGELLSTGKHRKCTAASTARYQRLAIGPFETIAARAG